MFLGTHNHRSWLSLVMEERGEICLTLRNFFATGKANLKNIFVLPVWVDWSETYFLKLNI